MQSLRSTSGTLIKLHNLGKKTGSLSNTEKERFKTQLSSLEETVSNIIKLIEDIGDDVDVLFKKTNSLRRTEDQYVDDEAGEGDVSKLTSKMFAIKLIKTINDIVNRRIYITAKYCKISLSKLTRICFLGLINKQKKYEKTTDPFRFVCAVQKSC